MAEGKRTLLTALFLGLINGLGIGLIAEHGRQIQLERERVELAIWGERVGIDIHLMDSFYGFWLPLLFTIVFGVMSFLVHKFLHNYLSSIILKWGLIGVFSIIILLPAFFITAGLYKITAESLTIGFIVFISTVSMNLLFGWFLQICERLNRRRQS